MLNINKSLDNPCFTQKKEVFILYAIFVVALRVSVN